MRTLAERFRHAREAKGLSQEELAEQVSIKQQTINKIEKSRIKHPRKIEKLAAFLGVTPEWLLFGTTLSEQTKSYNIPNLATNCKIIPVLLWDELTKLKVVQGRYLMDEALLKVPNRKHTQFFGKIPDNCFALMVQGDAMNSTVPNTRSFREGDILIVNPQHTPVSGNFVIAFIHQNESTFRQYIIDGDTKWLKPLNQQYPIIKFTKDTKIIGTVIKSFSDLI